MANSTKQLFPYFTNTGKMAWQDGGLKTKWQRGRKLPLTNQPNLCCSWATAAIWQDLHAVFNSGDIQTRGNFCCSEASSTGWNRVAAPRSVAWPYFHPGQVVKFLTRKRYLSRVQPYLAGVAFGFFIAFITGILYTGFFISLPCNLFP